LISVIVYRISLGFDWSALPAGGVVVDVGGCIGLHTLSLSKMFPSLRYVVQDAEEQITAARLVFSSFFHPFPTSEPSVV
jgi:hypothetical protein